MGHHLWQSWRPGGPLLQRKDRARRGCVRGEAGGPAPDVTRLQMKTEAERFLKGKSRTGSPPFSPFLIAQSLCRFSPPPSFPPSPPTHPARFVCLFLTSFFLNTLPSGARLGRRSGQLPGDPCPAPPPGPLPYPTLSAPGLTQKSRLKPSSRYLMHRRPPPKRPMLRPRRRDPEYPGPGSELRERREPAGRGRSARGLGRGLRGAGWGGAAGLEPAQGERGPGRTPSQEAGDGWERRWVGVERPEGAGIPFNPGTRGRLLPSPGRATRPAGTPLAVVIGASARKERPLGTRDPFNQRSVQRLI